MCPSYVADSYAGLWLCYAGAEAPLPAHLNDLIFLSNHMFSLSVKSRPEEVAVRSSLPFLMASSFSASFSASLIEQSF